MHHYGKNIEALEPPLIWIATQTKQMVCQSIFAKQQKKNSQESGLIFHVLEAHLISRVNQGSEEGI